MQGRNEGLDIHYFQVTDLWKRLCEEHNELFSLTCEEYAHLLSSDIDALNAVTEEKNEVITRINVLEKVRREIIREINTLLASDEQIHSAGDLIRLMRSVEERTGERHLYRFNQFLIDIIEKLQEQNKKNQMFLSKAMNNLREVREGLMGKKSYATYTASGKTITKSVQVDRSHP